MKRQLFKYIFSGLILFGIILLFLMLTLSNLRKEALQTHKHVATLRANTLEEHFSQILQNVNSTIDRIALLSYDKPNAASLLPIFNEFLQNTPYLRSLSLIDASGKILVSSFEANVGQQISFRHFLPIPFADNALLRVGVPWEGRDFAKARESTTSNPITPKALSFLPVIKKVTCADQTYYIAASLNTDYLNNYYEAILPAQEGNVFLWRIDGTLLFSTDPNSEPGISHYSDGHRQDKEDFYDHVMLYKHSALDLFKIAQLFPFVVEIKTDEATALAYWDKERENVLWLSSALIFLSGLLSLILIIRYMKENERQKQQIAYEKQFRIAMEATQTGLWTWNLITNEVTWDAQCFSLLGYEPNAFDVTLEKIYQLTHPDESTTMFFAIKEQIIAQHSFVVERRMRNAEGKWIWLQVRGKVIEFTEENEAKLLTGVYINIDAQKKAENLYINAVAFETQEAILITDAKEKVMKVNEAFTRITGFSDVDIIGKTPRILRSGKHNKAFYDKMWQALHTVGFWQGEMWNKRKNGEVYAEFLTITAIKDAHGAITHYIANFSDITRHKTEQDQIQEMAYYDPLTHLANRRMLDETMNKLLLECAQKLQYHALIFIDLDYFKTLNDKYGHDEGDMLLVQVAARLKDSTRQSDVVVRLGGDEFVIVLTYLGHQKGVAHYLTETISQKILTLLCEPYALSHGNHILGASIGCTLFGDDTSKNEATLLKEADQAMYKAKENGRNQIYFHAS